MKKNNLICIVGMPGAGKSIVSDWFVEQGFAFFRFGQVVLDYFKDNEIKPTEKKEKEIREGLRKKHGMAVMAKLLYPKFKKSLKKKNLVADGLYSFSEYEYLKKRLGDQMVTIAVFTPPILRHTRLSKRKSGKKDVKLRFRSFTKAEAKARDYAEIKNIEKGGPIAMADYTILNTKDLTFLRGQIKKVWNEIKKEKQKA